MANFDSSISGKPSGFCFDNVARNAALSKLGVSGAQFKSTGTVIVGCVFRSADGDKDKEGVIIGCDSRATAGSFIADKDCIKLHKLGDTIYAAGAGTAADLDKMGDLLHSQLSLLEMNTGRKPRVIAAVRTAKQRLFQHMGHIGAYLIIGGVDFYGPYLGSVSADGSGSKETYLADGSGCLAAYGVLEKEYKKFMTEKEAAELVMNALQAGMSADLACGNSLRYAVIKRSGTEIHDGIVPDFCKSYPRELRYTFAPNTTKVLKKAEVKFDVVEAMEVA